MVLGKLKSDGLKNSGKKMRRNRLMDVFFVKSRSEKNQNATVCVIPKTIRPGPFMSQERKGAPCLGCGPWGEEICNCQGSKVRKNKVGAVMLSHIGTNL